MTWALPLRNAQVSGKNSLQVNMIRVKEYTKCQSITNDILTHWKKHMKKRDKCDKMTKMKRCQQAKDWRETGGEAL